MPQGSSKSGGSSRDKADRRAGPHQGPYVNKGKLPRARNKAPTYVRCHQGQSKLNRYLP
jgi:hypothetical protein